MYGHEWRTELDEITTTIIDPASALAKVEEEVFKLQQIFVVRPGVEQHGAWFSDSINVLMFLTTARDNLLPVGIFHHAVSLLCCIGATTMTYHTTLTTIKAQKEVK